MLKRIMVALLAAAMMSACVPVAPGSAPASDTPDVNVIVAQTLAALTAQAALTPPTATEMTVPLTETPAVTPTPVPGSISGTLSYPSSFLPPMRVVAFRTDGMLYRYVETMQDQGTYQIDGLPPGTYHVVAYTGGLAGGYTAMVPCGLTVDCTDHSLIDVVVLSGQDTPNINPGDWYAPEGTFPPRP